MKKGLKRVHMIVGGVLFTLLYCFFVNGIHLDSEFEIVRHTPAPVVLAEAEDVTKININTASAKELETVHGIGEKMAQRIIEYRTKHGDFKQIQDIMKISGIGKKTFEEMKDEICVD